jgi:hypothetical protein
MINSKHMYSEIYNPIRIGPLIIIPSYKFKEIRIELYTSIKIKDTTSTIMDKIRTN